MSEVDIKFIGADQLQRRLDSLAESLKTKGTRRALVHAIAPIKATAKKTAPSKTGLLRSAIGHSSLSKSAKSRLSINSSTVALLIGANKKTGKYRQAYKQMFIEFGIKAHKIKPKGRKKALAFGDGAFNGVEHPGVKANPFLGNALDAHESRIVPRFWEGLESYLTRIDR